MKKIFTHRQIIAGERLPRGYRVAYITDKGKELLTSSDESMNWKFANAPQPSPILKLHMERRGTRMKIRFTKNVITDATMDICCVSGGCSKRFMSFKAGDCLEIVRVDYGEKAKTKTRPGQPGHQSQKCRIILKGQNEATTHPDYFEIDRNDFEILEATP